MVAAVMVTVAPRMPALAMVRQKGLQKQHRAAPLFSPHNKSRALTPYPIHPHHTTLSFFCADGFFGGDCSLRVCPAGKGFVDTPRGDLNHNGLTEATGYSIVQGKPRNYQQYESWPNTAALGGWTAQAGESHFDVECSGKGSCDRTMGVCKCFDGYTGASCQRSEWACWVGTRAFVGGARTQCLDFFLPGL